MALSLINGTSMAAGTTMGLDPDGREHIVVVVKGTFQIPRGECETCALGRQQKPLVEADTFVGAPGLSAPLSETDYAPFKPRCDVLLHGRAYAPRGPVSRLTVSLRVGAMSKVFEVIGHRSYERTLSGLRASKPQPFTVMPIGYDRAFGGVDRHGAQEDTYRPNPVGLGWYRLSPSGIIEGRPLPNTQAVGEVDEDPRRPRRAMAFGPIGRGWLPRANFAGTYNQEWLDNQFPFLPNDFDVRYHQAAPLDQQIDYPRGGEDVVLANLSPEGDLRFRLPDLTMPIEIETRSVGRVTLTARPDTIVIFPDEELLSVTFRASLPLRKDIFEVQNIVVGQMPKGFYRARARGKTYYPSLGALAGASAKGKGAS